MALQESGEMYLETIYVLSKANSHVRSVDISEHMGYSKPSVSRAVRILKEENYIVSEIKVEGTDLVTADIEDEELSQTITKMLIEKVRKN